MILPLGDPPALATPRLMLRAPAMTDAPAIAALADDGEIARRVSRLPHPYGLADAHHFLLQVAPSELAWGIFASDNGGFLGLVGLAPHPDGVLELGYWLGRPHWGQGFASEAAAAVVAHALDQFGTKTLVSGCFADNAASHRVLSKIGFRESGRSERSCLALGQTLPFIDMRHARCAPAS